MLVDRECINCGDFYVFDDEDAPPMAFLCHRCEPLAEAGRLDVPVGSEPPTEDERRDCVLYEKHERY